MKACYVLLCTYGFKLQEALPVKRKTILFVERKEMTVCSSVNVWQS